MKVAFAPNLDQRGTADLLVLPFWEGGKEAAAIGALKHKLEAPLHTQDFKGKLGDTLVHYMDNGVEPRVLLLGLGPEGKLTAESLRRAYAAAVRAARGKKAKSVNFVFPETKLHRDEALRGFFEGIALTNYLYFKLKHDTIKENPPVLMDCIYLIGLHEGDRKLIEKLETIIAGVFTVRDLVNSNADDKVPAALADFAQECARANPLLQVKILDKHALEKEGMGLILAVSRGSSHEPRLVEMSYRGDFASKEHIVLVGKGITYDTGGLSLKPTDGMLTMKCDMAGAATVLGVVKTAAALSLKINVTAVAPLAENCIDGKSYKIGDVYRAHNGKTVEVNNTDAEGRLVLADAMSYALKYLHPTCMIDIATLTGSIIMALGDDISGLFASDDTVSDELMAASKSAGEPLWRMPLYVDYKESIKSEVADLVNTSGKEAGAMKAAFFLQEFAGNVPWAHIDFAGPAFHSKPKHYNTSQATGYGVRLLLEFLHARGGS